MLNRPLFTRPIAKTALWGGRRLAERFGYSCPYPQFSEAWVLSVREHDRSPLIGGGTLWKQVPRPFPLLIKWIDARDKLSVQVHPNNALAAQKGDQGKTEMWYILEAAPGAELIYGLKEGVTAADFAAAVQAGRVEETLHHQPVKAGECYFIPAGLVHGIGAGIVVAEIQQNSDLTYRVYDYDRTDARGEKRPLHVREALEAARPFSAEEIDRLRYARGRKGLACCEWFFAEQCAAPCAGTARDFEILLALSGAGTLWSQDTPYAFRAGDCCYLPHGTEWRASGNTVFLRIKEREA